MRVATFNILHGAVPGSGEAEPGLLAEAVASLDADLVGLQEVDHRQPRSGEADLTSVAAQAMGARAHRFAAALAGTPEASWTAATGEEQPDAAAYGVAFLSRHPVLEWQVVRLPAAPSRLPHVRPGGRRVTLVRDEARVGLVALVASPAGPVRVVTTHLSFLRLWNGVQLRRLVRTVRGGPAPTLLLGDLNMGAARATRITGMESLASAPTFPAQAAVLRIDHVLGRGPLRATRTHVVRTPISDHLALVTDVDVTSGAGSPS